MLNVAVEVVVFIQDQLCGNRAVDLRLCFCDIHVDSKIPLLPKSKTPIL